MLTTTELYRSSIMANLDYNVFLGKRVRVIRSYPDNIIPSVDLRGLFLGFVKYAEGYEFYSCPNEILFLQDGFEEPDFICFDFLELID